MRTLLLAALLLLVTLGCGDGAGTDGDPDAGPPDAAAPDAGPVDYGSLAAQLAQRAIEDWEGVDYSFVAPDGLADSDLDGEVDANDAVIVIRTLQAMGYEVPETTLTGLHRNAYLEAGFGAEDGWTSEEGTDFPYTRALEVTEADLKAADFGGLQRGDLVFVDFDRDFVWDNAAIYLGPHGGFEHAAFLASDYHDRALVVDLGDAEEVLRLDIGFGRADARRVDFESLESFRR